jgi:hypothetical protein
VSSGINEKINSAATISRYNFGYNCRAFNHGIGSNASNDGWDGTPANYTCSIYQNVAVNTEMFHDTQNGPIEQLVNCYNNTYYGQSQLSGGATYVQVFRSGSDANVYNSKNNIWHLTTSSGGGLVYEDAAGAAVSCLDGSGTKNNLYPGTLRWLGGTYTTLATWAAAVGGESGSDTYSPNFVSAGTLTPESYKISGAALTAGDTGGPVGAYITGSEQIGCNF